MQKYTSEIPIELQLQAVCAPRVQETYDLLVSFQPELKEWNPKNGFSKLFREHARFHLNFTASDLIRYLNAHPELCEALLRDSYDKRYSPSTFIEEWKDNQYRVGWVPIGNNSMINQIRVFSAFIEATADYVLFSWGFPRLSKEQANWFEMEHY